MIVKKDILAILAVLNRSYNKASSQRESILCSKLAILELCGWIEESMDDVVLKCAHRRLKDPANVTYIRDEIVKRTYGFDYQHHFRRMLIHLLGLINVEKLEKTVDQEKQVQLKATLEALTSVRNSQAHTHTKGTMQSINAPSVTIGQLPAIYDGLKEYERTIRNTT